MGGIKHIILGISAVFGLVGSQAYAQILAPEDIPFTQDVQLIKTRGNQLCVIQFLADKGTYRNYTLAIKKGKIWQREFPVISVALQKGSTSIDFKDIEFFGNKIVIAGNFKMYNSSKNCILFYDKPSGATAWKADYEFSKPNEKAVVNSLTMGADFLYVGGNFTKIVSPTVGGEYLNIAKIQVNNLALLRILFEKNNGADSTVNSIELDTTNKILYVGGYFRKIAGQSIKGLAKFKTNDTSKPVEYTIAKSLISIAKMRFIGGKLYAMALQDTSTTGYGVFAINGNLTRIKGIQNVYQVNNFFTFGSMLYLQGYVKPTGQSSPTLGLFAFSEIVPLGAIYSKFGTISGADVYNGDIYIGGNFKAIQYEFSFGRIVSNYQRFVGRVFADLDGSGTFTAGDKLIPKRSVRVFSNAGLNNILQSNALGLFSFSYTTQPIQYKVVIESQGELTSNASYFFKGDTAKERVVDFPLKYKKNNYTDVTVRMTAATGWITRKDTSEIYVLTLSNQGLVDVTVPKLNLNFNKVKDIKTFPAHNVTNTSSVTWNDQKINAGEEKSFIIKLTVPSANYATGQSVQFNTNFSGVADDNTANNTDSLQQTVIQGVAPFLKLQNPPPASGDSFAWLNPSLGKIDYTIRFSNFGKDTTNTVVVKDTISTPDYVTYIQELGASHAFTRQVYISPYLADKVIVIYTFNNIDLPPNPSGNAEVSSASGFISFRVGLSPTLIPSGASLRNRASIYMDYETPVLTNTVVAKIPTTGTKTIENQPYTKVFPNPCSEVLNFSPNAVGATIQIFAMDGRFIGAAKLESESLSIAQFEMLAGSYLYRIEQPGKWIGSGILIKN